MGSFAEPGGFALAHRACSELPRRCGSGHARGRPPLGELLLRRAPQAVGNAGRCEPERATSRGRPLPLGRLPGASARTRWSKRTSAPAVPHQLEAGTREVAYESEGRQGHDDPDERHGAPDSVGGIACYSTRPTRSHDPSAAGATAVIVSPSTLAVPINAWSLLPCPGAASALLAGTAARSATRCAASHCGHTIRPSTAIEATMRGSSVILRPRWGDSSSSG
jgi:hypothetical protein